MASKATRKCPERRGHGNHKGVFPGQYELKSGSHIVIQDERLIGVHGYGPNGDFDILVKGGQRVKGYYLKKLAQTIKLLEEIE